MSSVSTMPNSEEPGIGRRSITVRSVDEMMSLTGVMTYCTASIACVPMSISAPAPAVSFA